MDEVKSSSEETFSVKSLDIKGCHDTNNIRMSKIAYFSTKEKIN